MSINQICDNNGNNTFLPKVSVGAPSYTFTGDSSTGMYSAGVGNVDFVTTGVKKLKIADDLITSYVPITAPTVSAIVLTGDSMLSWNVTIPFTLLSLFASGAVTASGYYPSNNSGATFFPGAMNNTSQSYGTVTFYAPCAMTVSIFSTIVLQSNQGIHEIVINGVSAGTKDAYKGSNDTASWVLTDATLLAGANTFQLKVNGKNASSSAYWLGYFQSNGFLIYRTA